MTPRKVVLTGWAFLATALVGSSAFAEGTVHERQPWSFGGITGKFDPAQLQRGFQIYQQVCSNCHSLKRLSFRNLTEPGGPAFPEDTVKELAASWPNKPRDVPSDNGDMVERPATLTDSILGPFRNDAQARAALGGAVPPDLSVVVKARGFESHAAFYAQPFLMLRDMLTGYQESGADFVYGVLTGYGDAPFFVKTSGGQLVPAPLGSKPANAQQCATIMQGVNGQGDVCTPVAEGRYYNAGVPGHQIAMPPPLSKDSPVKYQDGSGSFQQNAHDVTAFLAWAADPHLDTRKQTGWEVMLYLLITAVLVILLKRRIWRSVH